jgi:hypothetical protein
MPALESDNLWQYAVLWVPTGTDRYGRRTVDRENPREVRCRWEYGRKGTLNPQGETVALDATVVVDSLVPVGSQLWPGRLIEWQGLNGGLGDDPLDEPLYEVLTSSAIPDIKGRNTRRTLGLVRSKDTLNTNGAS